MKSNANLDARLDCAKQVLLDWVDHCLCTKSCGMLAPDGLYSRGVAALTEALLRSTGVSHHQTDGRGLIIEQKLRSRVIDELGPLPPEQVGELYQSLRGLRLEIDSEEGPVLISHAGGRRNQGLFYTPGHIVEQIVARAFDALEISEPEDYLDLKILDPAVGTGVFLAQALQEVTLRVLSRSGKERGAISPKIEKIQRKISMALSAKGINAEPSLEDAISIHVMTSCLYGVDLDPIAARIARAVLTKRAFGNLPATVCLSPNIRAGNSLMGSARCASNADTKTDLDRMHARAYFGKETLQDEAVREWSQEKNIFHWPLEFPEVFHGDRDGFDIIIGNPPYEIISVKESGILERTQEQVYFRRSYRSCHGKINTYRLMMERALDLLHESGALGFIVPATLLADSTAEKLRRIMLDETRVDQSIIIPEKSQVFKGVTQAFVIFITRKPGPTESFHSVIWDANVPTRPPHGIEISRRIIEAAGLRIPLIRSSKQRDLLETLTRIPPLGGDSKRPALGKVHQGEINLTTHREFITASPTEHPLIRGEHVAPLRLMHPSPGRQRLDWVLPEFLERRPESMPSPIRMKTSDPRGQATLRGRPWEAARIAIGRVVNMDTRFRLKAAAIPAGSFLGDMTNFISGANIPNDYLLGLLNSRLLNWRFKITSTNNYLSAAEIEALPIPRIPKAVTTEKMLHSVRAEFENLQSAPDNSMREYLREVNQLLKFTAKSESKVWLALMVQWVVQAIRAEPPSSPQRIRTGLWNLLDAVIVLLYQVDAHISVLEDEFSVGP